MKDDKQRTVELATGPAASALGKIYDQLQNQNEAQDLLREIREAPERKKRAIRKMELAKRTKKRRAKTKRAKQARKRNR